MKWMVKLAITVLLLVKIIMHLAFATVFHDLALKKLLENMSASDAEKGAVIAAKSKANPNYYYHWIRDAALSYDALITVYEQSHDSEQKDYIRQKLVDYRNFSARLQRTSTLSGLGEPKFYVNGDAFNDAWARPQNDGPALRAISFIRWANILLQEGREQYVREALYDAKLPATLPIKIDLEYVSHHWRDASFDLWEEVLGEHFYTLMVTRKALLDGALLAEKMHDNGAAVWYRQQGKAIEAELKNFWDDKKQLIKPTINQVGGLNDKTSDLDTAVILGLLHGDRQDGFMPWDDLRVTATVRKLITVFHDLYPINQQANIPGIAIGRYPEDKYSGGDSRLGNPWVLCTYAIAEGLYRYASALDAKGKYQQALNVRNDADQFISRVNFHANKDGSLNEQINRDTGYMTSAYDLTWNYAAILTLENSMAKKTGLIFSLPQNGQSRALLESAVE